MAKVSKRMAQKASVQKTASKSKKKYPVTHGEVVVEIEIFGQAAPSGIQEAKPNGTVPAVRSDLFAGEPERRSLYDDDLWDAAIENSIDTIRELADKALADRQAGRTKKITI